ncbi:MAG: (deoxy)nucleoside triphosphate pyrophosphohydrolase [Gemmatimonadota bacterium]
MPRRVVGAVIRDDRDRVLLCRRPEEKRHGGRWEFPGGKILRGESILQAARRELSEELDVEVVGVRGQPVPVQDPASEWVVEFVETMVEGEPRAREHTEVVWVPRDEVADYDLAPADRDFAENYLSTVLGVA